MQVINKPQTSQASFASSGAEPIAIRQRPADSLSPPYLGSLRVKESQVVVERKKASLLPSNAPAITMPSLISRGEKLFASQAISREGDVRQYAPPLLDIYRLRADYSLFLRQHPEHCEHTLQSASHSDLLNKLMIFFRRYEGLEEQCTQAICSRHPFNPTSPESLLANPLKDMNEDLPTYLQSSLDIVDAIFRLKPENSALRKNGLKFLLSVLRITRHTLETLKVNDVFPSELSWRLKQLTDEPRYKAILTQSDNLQTDVGRTLSEAERLEYKCCRMVLMLSCGATSDVVHQFLLGGELKPLLSGESVFINQLLPSLLTMACQHPWGAKSAPAIEVLDTRWGTSGVEGPVAEESVAEEPVAEEPVEEPVVEESVIERSDEMSYYSASEETVLEEVASGVHTVENKSVEKTKIESTPGKLQSLLSWLSPLALFSKGDDREEKPALTVQQIKDPPCESLSPEPQQPVASMVASGCPIPLHEVLNPELSKMTIRMKKLLIQDFEELYCCDGEDFPQLKKYIQDYFCIRADYIQYLAQHPDELESIANSLVTKTSLTPREERLFFLHCRAFKFVFCAGSLLFSDQFYRFDYINKNLERYYLPNTCPEAAYSRAEEERRVVNDAMPELDAGDEIQFMLKAAHYACNFLPLTPSFTDNAGDYLRPICLYIKTVLTINSELCFLNCNSQIEAVTSAIEGAKLQCMLAVIEDFNSKGELETLRREIL